MTFPLTGKQRRFLRGLGHALKPVVQVGHAGLTEPVLKAIDLALETHELIKIKVAAEAGDGAEALVEPLELRARTTVAQVVGKTLLVYRGRKKTPAIVLPDEHQPGSVSPPEKVEKPRPGTHLAKKKRGKRGAKTKARTDANRHEEGARRENASRRAASQRRTEPGEQTDFGGRDFGRRATPAGRTTGAGRSAPAGRSASFGRGAPPRRPKRAV